MMQQVLFLTLSLFSQELPRAPPSCMAAFSKLRAEWPPDTRSSGWTFLPIRADIWQAVARILLTTVCRASPKALSGFSLLYFWKSWRQRQASPQIRATFDCMAQTFSRILASSHVPVNRLFVSSYTTERGLAVSLVACWGHVYTTTSCHFWWAPQLPMGHPAACTAAPRCSKLSCALCVGWGGGHPSIQTSIRQQISRCHQSHSLLLWHFKVCIFKFNVLLFYFI